MKKLFFTTVILFLSLTQISCGKSDKILIDLSRDWKISHENQKAFSQREHDDSSWNTISKLPALLHPERKKHNIWLRKTITIPSSLEGKSLAIHLGKIWDVETTYINGVRIGDSGRPYPEFHSDWNVDVYHYIPENVISFGGENTIAIHVFSNQMPNFNGSPYIGNHFDVRAHNYWQRFLAEYLPLSTGLFTLFLGITLLLHFLLTRNRDSMHIGGMSILWFIGSLHFYMPSFGFISWQLQDQLFYIIMSFEILWIYYYNEKLLGKKYTVLRVIVIIILIATIILSITSSVENPITGWRFDALGALAVIGQILWGIVIIDGIRRGKRQARILFWAYLFFMICMVHDALMMNRIILSNAFLSNIAYPAFLFAFEALVFIQMANLTKNLKRSTVQIEESNSSLHVLFQSVKESSDELTNMSNEIEKATINLNDEMKIQAESLSDTSAAINRVSESIAGVAESTTTQDSVVQKNRDMLLDYIKSLDQITRAAGKAVSLSVKNQGETGEINQKLDTIKDGMLKIKDSSGRIKQITDMINEIAEQTNLLSLNASIEAARAGQAGKGFAVVAEEIGKLADNSLNQAKTIQQIVQEIVQNIDDETNLIMESSQTVINVTKAVDDVNQAIDLILELCVSQESLTNKIQDNMELIAKGSTTVSTAADDQTHLMDDVRHALDSMTEVMEKVNDSADKMTAISEILATRIALMNSLIDKRS